MLKEEFDKLMGCKSSDDAYNFANIVYMSTDMDKKPFCDMWKHMAPTAKLQMYDMALKIDGMAGKIKKLEGVCVQYAEFMVKYDGKIFPERMQRR